MSNELSSFNLQTSIKTTADQLGIIKISNTIGYSGNNSGFRSPIVDIDDFLWDKDATTGDNTSGVEFLAYINGFENWHNDKFRWEGLPGEIDKPTLENFLFRYNQLVFFKNNNEYIFLPFNLEKADRYGNPWKVRPVEPFNKKNDTQRKVLGLRTVGKDCVILRHNVGGALTANGSVNSDIRKLWIKLIDVIYTRDAIFNITTLNVPRIPLGKDTDTTLIETMKSILKSTTPFIPWDENFNVQLAGGDKENGLVRFDIDVADWWINYKNYLNDAKMVVGGTHDANFQKKERKNVEETQIENNSTNSILRSQFEMREISVKKINEMFDTKIKVFWNPEFKNEIILPEVNTGNDPIK